MTNENINLKMQLKIDTVESREGTPLLLHFQNGYINEKFGSAQKSSLLLAGEGKTVIAAEIDDVLYAGEEIQEELGKTLILVHNKITGKVRLLEVGSACMRAVISNNLSLTSKQEKLNTLDLSRKFGSKKDKQKMEQREKLKVNTEVMNEQFKKLAEDATVLEKIDLKTFSNPDSEEFYIPPMNRNAQHVQDVYTVSAILSEEQIETVSNEVESKDWLLELNPYFAKSATKKMSKTEKALTLYANSLLKMYLERVPNITKKSFTVCNTSHTINEVVMENFTQTVNNRRGRSNPLKDKTLCYLMVIVLLLNNYKLDVEDLSNAIKMSCSKMLAKARTVGAHVSSNKKSLLLKLPLNNTNTFAGRRKSAKF